MKIHHKPTKPQSNTRGLKQTVSISGKPKDRIVMTVPDQGSYMSATIKKSRSANKPGYSICASMSNRRAYSIKEISIQKLINLINLLNQIR